MPWLSVVTVVKDDPAGFARSMHSLAAQNLGGVEWVVIDGSDDLVPIRALVAESAFPVIYGHETPRGIYAAMNSALETATGEFVYFLNAGDTFAAPSVLSEVRSRLGADSTWGFGPVEIEDSEGRVVVTPPWDYHAEQLLGFSRGLFAPHQGTFARTEALRDLGGFDASYRIAADYAAFLHLSLRADPALLPVVIARFREGGTSTSEWQESFREFHRARRQILQPTGTAAVRERWETARHFAKVFVYREIRPRLGWPRRRPI